MRNSGKSAGVDDVSETETVKTSSRVLSKIPLIFVGLGFYRAWIEIVYVGSFSDFPIQSFFSRDVFDISAVIVWFAAAVFAKRLSPLSRKRGVFVLAGSLLVIGTLLNFLSIPYPQISTLFSLPAAACSGVGIALIVLLWSEFYGCLNPLRVAVCYAVSIIVGAATIYLYKGLIPEYLAWMTMLLPVLSAWFAYRSFATLSSDAQPRSSYTRFSFPWKPVLLMAVYSFAYGLKEGSLYDAAGPHSSFGAVAAAIVVLVGVIYQGKKFDFGVMYRFGLPCMIGAFLLVPALGFPNEQLSVFCATLSYTAFSILIMIVLSNMAYRYGMNALWLFGIERGVRQLLMVGGRETESFISHLAPVLPQGEVFVNVVIVLLITATTMILLSEKDIASRWGVDVVDSPGGVDVNSDDEMRLHKRGEQCAAVAKRYGLSMRESEVLLLLAQKKSIGAIERELFIANGTAKAHVRHIYQKLDIHTREELFGLLAEGAADEGNTGHKH